MSLHLTSHLLHQVKLPDGSSATGSSTNKKTAKHNAARAMLDQMAGKGEEEEDEDAGDGRFSKAALQQGIEASLRALREADSDEEGGEEGVTGNFAPLGPARGQANKEAGGDSGDDPEDEFTPPSVPVPPLPKAAKGTGPLGPRVGSAGIGRGFSYVSVRSHPSDPNLPSVGHYITVLFSVCHCSCV